MGPYICPSRICFNDNFTLLIPCQNQLFGLLSNEPCFCSCSSSQALTLELYHAHRDHPIPGPGTEREDGQQKRGCWKVSWLLKSRGRAGIVPFFRRPLLCFCCNAWGGGSPEGGAATPAQWAETSAVLDDVSETPTYPTGQDLYTFSHCFFFCYVQTQPS